MWRVGAQVSREPPPPLPGGYVLGEQVYYMGTTKTLESSDRLEHGKQGEVVGAAEAESFKGKGVAVLFPGNKGGISCFLDEVRRFRMSEALLEAAAPPAADEGAAPPNAALSLACIGCYRLPSDMDDGREKHPICDMCRDEKLPTTYQCGKDCPANPGAWDLHGVLQKN